MEVGQVAEALVEVETVAHEELVRDREPNVAHRQIVDKPAVGPIEQGHGCDRARPAQDERLRQRVQRQARVDDVLDEQDVLPDDVEVEILEQADRARAPGAASAVARELDEVDPVDDRQRARQVGEKDEARLQTAPS